MRLLASCMILVLALLLAPGHSSGMSLDAALQQALGSPDPLFKFSPDALVAAVRLCSSRDPADAGAYAAMVIRSGRPDADAIAPSLVRAAIEGLGPDPKPLYIGAIVRDAVHAAPSEVLDIVTAAIKASPRDAARDIVISAIQSVPRPERLITVNSLRRATRLPGAGKDYDQKDLTEVPQQLTLAEAIIQAATDADPSLNSADLAPSVDGSLVEGPPLLTTLLNPVIPVIPSGGPGGEPPAGSFAAPGPVSP